VFCRRIESNVENALLWAQGFIRGHSASRSKPFPPFNSLAFYIARLHRKISIQRVQLRFFRFL
jgi:hypothetical protein